MNEHDIVMGPPAWKKTVGVSAVLMIVAVIAGSITGDGRPGDSGLMEVAIQCRGLLVFCAVAATACWVMLLAWLLRMPD